MDEILRSEIIIVLEQKNEVVTFEEFAGLFHQTHGYQFQLSNYGYKSLKALLEDMKDLVVLEETFRGQVIKCRPSYKVTALFISGNSASQADVSVVSGDQKSPSSDPVLTNKTKNDLRKHKVAHLQPGCAMAKPQDNKPSVITTPTHEQLLSISEKKITHSGVNLFPLQKCNSSTENPDENKTGKPVSQSPASNTLPTNCTNNLKDGNKSPSSSNSCSTTQKLDVAAVIRHILTINNKGMGIKKMRKLILENHKVDLDKYSQSCGYSDALSMLKQMPDIELRKDKIAQLRQDCAMNKPQHNKPSETLCVAQKHGICNVVNIKQNNWTPKTFLLPHPYKSITTNVPPSTRTKELKTKKEAIKPSVQRETKNKPIQNWPKPNTRMMSVPYTLIDKKQYLPGNQNVQVADSKVKPNMTYAQASINNIRVTQRALPASPMRNANPNVHMVHPTHVHPRTEHTKVSINLTIKENIKNVLKRHTNGISLFQLQKFYMFIVGNPMSLSGYSSVKQLLMEMSDVVKMQGLGVQTLVYPISSAAVPTLTSVDQDGFSLLIPETNCLPAKNCNTEASTLHIPTFQNTKRDNNVQMTKDHVREKTMTAGQYDVAPKMLSAQPPKVIPLTFFSSEKMDMPFPPLVNCGDAVRFVDGKHNRSKMPLSTARNNSSMISLTHSASCASLFKQSQQMCTSKVKPSIQIKSISQGASLEFSHQSKAELSEDQDMQKWPLPSREHPFNKRKLKNLSLHSQKEEYVKNDFCTPRQAASTSPISQQPLMDIHCVKKASEITLPSQLHQNIVMPTQTKSAHSDKIEVSQIYVNSKFAEKISSSSKSQQVPKITPAQPSLSSSQALQPVFNVKPDHAGPSFPQSDQPETKVTPGKPGPSLSQSQKAVSNIMSGQPGPSSSQLQQPVSKITLSQPGFSPTHSHQQVSNITPGKPGPSNSQLQKPMPKITPGEPGSLSTQAKQLVSTMTPGETGPSNSQLQKPMPKITPGEPGSLSTQAKQLVSTMTPGEIGPSNSQLQKPMPKITTGEPGSLSTQAKQLVSTMTPGETGPSLSQSQKAVSNIMSGQPGPSSLQLQQPVSKITLSQPGFSPTHSHQQVSNITSGKPGPSNSQLQKPMPKITCGEPGSLSTQAKQLVSTMTPGETGPSNLQLQQPMSKITPGESGSLFSQARELVSNRTTGQTGPSRSQMQQLVTIITSGQTEPSCSQLQQPLSEVTTGQPVPSSSQAHQQSQWLEIIPDPPGHASSQLDQLVSKITPGQLGPSVSQLQQLSNIIDDQPVTSSVQLQPPMSDSHSKIIPGQLAYSLQRVHDSPENKDQGQAFNLFSIKPQQGSEPQSNSRPMKTEYPSAHLNIKLLDSNKHIQDQKIETENPSSPLQQKGSECYTMNKPEKQESQFSKSDQEKYDFHPNKISWQTESPFSQLDQKVPASNSLNIQEQIDITFLGKSCTKKTSEQTEFPSYPKETETKIDSNEFQPTKSTPAQTHQNMSDSHFNKVPSETNYRCIKNQGTEMHSDSGIKNIRSSSSSLHQKEPDPCTSNTNGYIGFPSSVSNQQLAESNCNNGQRVTQSPTWQTDRESCNIL
ncbi:uncharacterized protein O3C94_014025 [Discoglossus pictus]